jgi:glycosyltransferase involved in cell wall biosynthesis
MPKAEVGIYIPCFNSAETIKLCLEAVFKQTAAPKEVVIVDDGSTDETAEIVSRYPIRLIRHKENRGLAAARNTALKNIDTEFVASLDSDCLPQENWLEKLLNKFISPQIAGAGGMLTERYSSCVFDSWRAVHMRQHWGKEETSPEFLFGSNTLFLKAALIEAGCYNEDLKNNYEDVDICRRLKKNGYSFVYGPGAVVQHLKRDDIYSLLNSYWQWHRAYYQEKDYYSGKENFIFKVKDNLGLANRYIEEDISNNRPDLLYLDFLLALHHCLKDLDCYFHCSGQAESDYSFLSVWLSLLDLDFFYHFNSKEKRISTIIKKSNLFLHNFIALVLVLNLPLSYKFTGNFRNILCKHLLFSVCRFNDRKLLAMLQTIFEQHPDWNELMGKAHVNLDAVFLKNLVHGFEEWIGGLIFKFNGIDRMLEASAEKTELSLSAKMEGNNNERK